MPSSRRVSGNGHHEVTIPRGVGGGGGTGVLAQVGSEVGEGVRAAGVAQDDIQAGGNGQAGHRGADRAGPEQPEGFGHYNYLQLRFESRDGVRVRNVIWSEAPPDGG